MSESGKHNYLKQLVIHALRNEGCKGIETEKRTPLGHRVDIIAEYEFQGYVLNIAVECGQTDRFIIGKYEPFFHIIIHIPYDHAVIHENERIHDIEQKITGKIQQYCRTQRIYIQKHPLWKPLNNLDYNWKKYKHISSPLFRKNIKRLEKKTKTKNKIGFSLKNISLDVGSNDKYWNGIIDNQEKILEDDYEKGRR